MKNISAVKTKVLQKYTEGAVQPIQGLCCPKSYNPKLLNDIPDEILERDYGCGDPSQYVEPGQVVLDLGCGVGKMCYMVSRLVGESGEVIGVDVNTDMLSIARKYQKTLNKRKGCAKTRFVQTKIQDMTVDLEKLNRYLVEHPVTKLSDLSRLEDWMKRYERVPVIDNNSIDVVISNCVLNLVDESDRDQLIQQIYRVLKPGGRFAISDIVSDQQVSQSLKDNEELWADCVTGAFQEKEFAQAFLKKGFINIKYDAWSDEVWKTIDHINFRSVTLTGSKPYTTECTSCEYEVIYKGPFSQIEDDQGHKFLRGQRMKVCLDTYDYLLNECPESFIFVGPIQHADTLAKGNETNSSCC